MDRTVLATGSYGPTPVLGVHEIATYARFFMLKKPVFMVRPPGSVRSGSKNYGYYITIPITIYQIYPKDNLGLHNCREAIRIHRLSKHEINYLAIYLSCMAC